MKAMPKKPVARKLNSAQQGRSLTGWIAGLVLVSAGAGGAWWWKSQAGGDSASAVATGPAGSASAPASPASGAASGAAGARRFGGGNRVQPVSVMAVRKQDLRIVVNAIGNIAALNTAVVRSRVDGELKAVRFREGQQVKAGQLLAEIDSRSFEVALALAQAQLQRDQAQLRNAQLDLDRYKDLLSKDSIARQQVDTQDALVRQLQATVMADQANVDNAKLQLSYTQVAAPIGGRLGLRTVDQGNIVRAGDAAGLVTITQTQPIASVFAVPEANLAQINRQLRQGKTLSVEAWDREQRNKLATGRIIATDNAIDAATGTIKLKAQFENADGALFPNQFVNIRLQVDTQEGVTTIPANAVQRGAIGTFVYVVKEDNTVSVRRIRTGATEGDWIAVQGDLVPGERLVTDGGDRLREGSKVEVITPQRGFGGAGRPGGGAPGGAGGGAGGGTGGAMPGAVASGAAGSAASGGPAPGGAARPGRPDGAPPRGPEGGPPRGPDGAGRPPPPMGEGSPPPAGEPRRGPPPAAGAGGRPDAWIDQLPPEAQERVRRTLERLGPEAAAKVHRMTPEERREFFRQLRERAQQQSQN